FFVEQVQGGQRGGCGEAGEGRQAEGFAGIWGEERAEYFEGGGSFQEVVGEILDQPGRRGGDWDCGAHQEGGERRGERDAGGVAAAGQGDGGRPGFAGHAGGGAYEAEGSGCACGAHFEVSGD